MTKKGSSRYNGFGKTTHYDSKGRRTGYSQNSGIGKTTHYNAKGRKVGHSRDSGFGTTTHYDVQGRKVGKTYESGVGTSTHYDNRNRKVGYSYNTKFSSDHYSGQGGCYIATCVYGSYNCPEVCILRRFRDNFLLSSKLGSTFVKFYYKTSPFLVKHFGKFNWVKKIWKYFLDKLVTILDQNGYSNLPYIDSKFH